MAQILPQNSELMMKSLFKLVNTSLLAAMLVACRAGESNSAYHSLPSNQIDQTSFAVAYESTAQTYQDRVNESYDIQSFIRGVDEWYKGKIKQPIEQIRAGLLNRMLDHDVFAYYSGVLFAADLKKNFSRLGDQCWQQIQPASVTQGIFDAMNDLQKGTVRNDDYLKQGAERLIQLCVKQAEKTEPAVTEVKKQNASDKKKAKK